MKYIILICARGGSKGIAKKNIRKLSGKPLIAWSIEQSKLISSSIDTIVSTDSQEIAEISRNYGANIPFIRPNNLSQDNSPEWDVWKHAMDYIFSSYKSKIDGLIVIPPTAPLRSIEDINNCISEFEKNSADAVITVTDPHRNPYFNMVKRDSSGYLSILNQFGKDISRRQDAPAVLDVTTVAYIIKPEFIANGKNLLSGKVKGVYVPPERAIDIDTMFDFEIAEFLMKKKGY